MDTAKLRISAAALAGFCALFGAAVLSFALVIALTPAVGLLWATMILAGVYLLVAGIAGVIALRPDKSTEEEVSDIRSSAASELIELPMEMARKLADDHPMATIALAAALGYGVGSRPQEAVKLATNIKAWLG